MNANARALLSLTRAVSPNLREGASIVALSSLGAGRVLPNYTLVGASKAALEALVRYLAVELAPRGIRVNAVSPGPIETDLSAMNLTPVTRRSREERIPQGRLGKPGELAAAIAFLASSDAAYVNGTVLVVDGGLVSGGIREPK